MRLSEEIRKIADGCISEGISCSFPNYMGFDCGKTEGLECSDCTAMALMVLADKVELLERERYEGSDANKAVHENIKLSGDLAEWKREVLELCEYVGVDRSKCSGEREMLENAYDELGRRLMPPDYEWPRFEDGEPVRFGDETSLTDAVTEISFLSDGSALVGDCNGDFSVDRGERVKRPKPDPIGADGLPIKKGDKMRILDHICTREYCTVQKFGTSVLDGSLLVFDEFGTGWKPLDLAHVEEEPSDSWERLEHDAEGIERDCGGTWHKPDGSSVNVVDIVRRAKALAAKETDHED